MVSDRLSLLHACFPIDLSFTVNSFLDYRPLHTLLQTNTSNNSVTLNETFSITCTAEANPPAKYTIYKDETRVVGNSVVTSSVTERVKRVTFTCKPSNFYGVGQMADVSLDVLCKWNCRDSMICIHVQPHILWNVVVQSARNTCICGCSCIFFFVFPFCLFFFRS